jgi:insulysin
MGDPFFPVFHLLLHQAHGGGSNAYTSTENTNYYFDVLAGHLEKTLDQFSAFFVCPLFTASATSRELEAVNSENAKNLLSDMWRSFQLQKSTADPEHPFSKFGTGNRETLETVPAGKGIDVRQVLLDFHEKFYSASIMKLCVVGREPLDELQAMVEPRFSRIRNNGVVPPEYKEGSPYISGLHLPRRLSVVPVKDLRTVELGWPTRSLLSEYRQKPAGYVSHIIGHEGPGSLLSLLKAKGLADSLSAGMFTNVRGFGMFAISIDTTEDGIERVDDIVMYCYQYIKMLRESGTPRWIFDESQKIAENTFRFKSKENPQSYATTVASRMNNGYAPEDTLSGAYLYQEFDEAAIKSVVACLTPGNMRLQCTHRGFEAVADKAEAWYGTKYHEAEIPAEKLALWADPPELDAALHLPRPNELIASDFALRCESGGDAAPGVKGVVEGPPPPPAQVQSTPTSSVWHKMDTEFGLPKSYVNLMMLSPEAYASPRAVVLSRLYSEVVKDALNEFAYDAEVAGLNYSLRNTTRGLQLTVAGFNDKLPVLANRVGNMMSKTAASFDEERFRLIKDRIVLEYKNFSKQQPYRCAMYNINYMLRPTRWHNDDKLAVVDELGPEDMRQFSGRLLSNAFCEVLVHGNSSVEDATTLVSSFESALDYAALRPSQSLQIMAPRCMQLPVPTCDATHRMPGLDPENENSAVNLYWQVGPRDVRCGALLGLLAHLVREPCFDQLRTKEQLGYMVFSGMSDVNGVVGLWIIVQSSNKGPAYLDDRAENFLAQFRDEVLGAMDDDTFAKNVQACILTRTKKDKQLYEQAGRFWNEIEDCRYRFNRAFDEAEALKSITLDDVVALFDECIAKSGPKRRKLGCHVIGKGHAESDAALYDAQLAAGVTDVGATQASMDAFKMGMGVSRVPSKAANE